ncbi:MAG: hypothetical protein K0R65_3078 [Crocinitomicaceae bacterium]|jgi:hypothetical protein|nr:hypothetical protein [Crocinitomicaceae bacterium]
MKNTKKLVLLLVMVLGMGSAFSQLNGEQHRAINLARQAAADCIDHQELRGLDINYQLTETTICDFLPGPTGNAAIFGYRVDITAVGRCPQNVQIACLPVFVNVATVYVSCGNQEVMEVTCY